MGDTGVKCHETLETFWSLKWVTLVKDRLNSSGRLGLLILETFLSHESLRLTNGFWSVWCLSRKNISSFLWRGSEGWAGGCLNSVFLLFWFFSISWYSPHPFDFLCLVDFLLPVMCSHFFLSSKCHETVCLMNTSPSSCTENLLFHSGFILLPSLFDPLLSRSWCFSWHTNIYSCLYKTSSMYSHLLGVLFHNIKYFTSKIKQYIRVDIYRCCAHSSRY